MAARLGQGTVRAETPVALLVQLVDYDNCTIWIPKSVIDDDSEVYDSKKHAVGEVVVASWWAEKKDLA